MLVRVMGIAFIVVALLAARGFSNTLPSAGAQAPPAVAGVVPQAGQAGFVVALRELSVSDASSALRARGCEPASLSQFSITHQTWAIYVFDAPIFVNEGFPQVFAANSVFFVACSDVPPVIQVTPAPLPALEIVTEVSFVNIIGNTHIVGEVQNNSSVPLFLVQIVATYYGEDGGVVGTGSTYSSLSVITPHNTSPFEIMIGGFSAAPREHRLQVQGEEYSSYEVKPVEILSSSSFETYGMLHIVGEVRNNWWNAVDSVEIVATLYDAENAIVGTASAYAEFGTIQPGVTSPFEIINYASARDVASYKLQALGR